MRVICVCGARPNFMKVAPILAILNRARGVDTLLVHTGQHYDPVMSDLFFTQLGIPEPDVNLEVRSGTHARQTARIMERFEPVCQKFRPDYVIVVGDVNGTVACALVAAKLGIRVAHVEAGLRSFDRSMPEELNRVLTDAISDLLFVTEPSGVRNLRDEGIDSEKIHLVGNVMIDTLLRHRTRAAESNILARLGLNPQTYVLMTLHRPANVDDQAVLVPIMDGLARLAAGWPVVFPVHPRTRQRLEALGCLSMLADLPRCHLTDPLGYLDFVHLMSHARAVLTDSGGIQEETTILGVPCLTLRRNTERPITIEEGTNRLIPPSASGMRRVLALVEAGPIEPPPPPRLWDGRAAERITHVLADRFRGRIEAQRHAKKALTKITASQSAKKSQATPLNPSL